MAKTRRYQSTKKRLLERVTQSYAKLLSLVSTFPNLLIQSQFAQANKRSFHEEIDVT